MALLLRLVEPVKVDIVPLVTLVLSAKNLSLMSGSLFWPKLAHCREVSVISMRAIVRSKELMFAVFLSSVVGVIEPTSNVVVLPAFEVVVCWVLLSRDVIEVFIVLNFFGPVKLLVRCTCMAKFKDLVRGCIVRFNWPVEGTVLVVGVVFVFVVKRVFVGKQFLFL